MLIRRIEGCTRMLGAPSDWDGELNGKCNVLPVADTEFNGNHWMVSAWEPTPEELKALNAGASIRLYICGVRHPVVSLAVGEIPK